MPRDCTIDVNQCFDCPQIQPTQGRPGSVVVEPRLSWDAGANSIQVRSGDWAIFNIQPSLDCGGIVIGSRSVRDRQSDPTQVEHALYFRSVNGDSFVSVIESGEQQTSPVMRAESDVFEIRRVSGVIRYLRNGLVIYASGVRSTGAKLVTACMYASGDVVA